MIAYDRLKQHASRLPHRLASYDVQKTQCWWLPAVQELVMHHLGFLAALWPAAGAASSCTPARLAEVMKELLQTRGETDRHKCISRDEQPCS